MTEIDAYHIARTLADKYQAWYEIHTNGIDYVVVEQGDNAGEGYEHFMTLSPRVRISNAANNTR